jgi:hypothetical protein
MRAYFISSFSAVIPGSTRSLGTPSRVCERGSPRKWGRCVTCGVLDVGRDFVEGPLPLLREEERETRWRGGRQRSGGQIGQSSLGAQGRHQGDPLYKTTQGKSEVSGEVVGKRRESRTRTLSISDEGERVMSSFCMRSFHFPMKSLRTQGLSGPSRRMSCDRALSQRILCAGQSAGALPLLASRTAAWDQEQRRQVSVNPWSDCRSEGSALQPAQGTLKRQHEVGQSPARAHMHTLGSTYS